jgi:murein DD-endopeptidase MepM/ murein hydrolase activator NlpD
MTDTNNPENQEQTTGGLSQLPSVSTQVKMTPGGKGQLATLSAPSGVLMSEASSKGILDNMQKMLDEYNDPYKKFQDSLQKAHAWTLYDKTPAFREINAQEEQDRANKYNIAQSMNTFKANQIANQTLAKSLLSQGAGGVQGTPSTAQAQAGLAAQSPIDAATQAEIDRLITQEGNVGAAQELRKKAYQDYLDQSMRNKFNVDWDAPVENVMVNGVPRTITRRAFSQMAESNPGLLKENPTLAKEITSTPAPSVTPTIGSPQGARSVPGIGPGVHNGIDMPMGAGTAVNSFTGGTVKYAGDAGDGYGNKVIVQNPDGTTTLYAHLSSIGVKPGDTVDRNAPLGAAGQTGKATGPHLHVEVRDDKNQPMDAKSYLANIGKPQTSATPPAGSVQEYESNLKMKEAANQAFLSTTHKALSDKVAAQENDETNARQILGSLDKGKFGPGTSIDQGLSTALQAVGVEPNKEEQLRYLNNLNIEQARQLFSASGARAAMGAQFTENESKRFLQTLAGIDNPKKYIKQVYQLKIAEAKLNQARLDYLNEHPTTMAQADKDWRNSSAREDILKQYAPIYSKISDKAYAAAKKDTSKTEKAVSATGMVTDKNHPHYGEKAIKYSDGSISYEKVK